MAPATLRSRRTASAAPPRFGVPFRPPRWARGGHAQTLFGHLLPSRAARIDARSAARREIELADGERLVAYTIDGTSGVRVHLFHGLSGDANSDYMRRAASALTARGHHVWAVNHRGCGDGRGLASRPYHSGRSEDMSAVLAASRNDAPELVHLVIGFSLSGNIALLLAAQELEPLPDGLIAVNPPVDIERATLDMHVGLSRLYEARFIWRLRRAIKERERDGLARSSYEIPLSTSLREFDDRVTAPECGFVDGLDYYRTASTIHRLNEIEVPSVILSAQDDPFVHPDVYDGATLSSSVLLHQPESGGHVGYVGGDGGGHGRWLDAALVHYVDALSASRR